MTPARGRSFGPRAGESDTVAERYHAVLLESRPEQRAHPSFRRSTIAAFALLAACRPSQSAPQVAEPSSKVVDASVAAPAPPPKPLGPAVDETAPTVSLAARTDISTRLQTDKEAVIEGTWTVSQDNEAEGCSPEIVLDHPTPVFDEKGKPLTDGRGLGRHPKMTPASHLCPWTWKDGTNAMPMLPSGSRVVVRATPTPPIRDHHPNMVLLFDLQLLSASPPVAAVPAELPDGQYVVFVREAEPHVVRADLAFLYYGEAAQKLAEERHAKTSGHPPHYLADDRHELRTIPLRRGETAGGMTFSPLRLEPRGWVSMSLAECIESEAPFIVEMKHGFAVDMRKVDYDRVLTNR